jgi:hypothetical protein
MMEAIRSSETLVLTTASRRHIPEDKFGRYYNIPKVSIIMMLSGIRAGANKYHVTRTLQPLLQ